MRKKTKILAKHSTTTNAQIYLYIDDDDDDDHEYRGDQQFS
jgi:hypothetical protein